MSRRTRYFLIGSVAVLVFGLSIGLFAYYNGGLQGLTSGGGPDQLRYVPRDAAVVAYADVHQIMNSQFRQHLKQLGAAKTENGQQEFRDQTGIDLERDVNSVVAFMTPGADNSPGSGAVVASGTFDEGRIESLVRGKGGQVTMLNGKKFMTFGGEEGKAGALAFVSGDMVVVGSDTAVRRAVELGNADAGIRSNEKMAKLIGDVAPRGNAWVVGRFDALTSQARLPEQLTDKIPPISWFAASGEINGGVAAALTVETANADAANNLAMVIQGLKGLAGLQAGPNAAQMRQALQSFGVSQDGPKLTVSFSLPAELLDALTAQHRGPGQSK